jgi:general secretion pathway protein K
MRRPARPRARRQRGAALLLAMVILTLVVTVSAGMVWQQTRAVQVEAAERARSQAGWILNGALDWARLILAEDQRSGRQRAQAYDAFDEPWATPLAEARLSTFLAADKDNNSADAGPEAFLSGAIVDAQSRWNLRGLIDGSGKPVPAEQAALERLVRLAGLPDDTALRIVEQLRRSWAPAGGDAADNEDLAVLPPTQLADLAWGGLEPAQLARLAPWVVLLPVRTPVNANTASREALMAAIDNLDLGGAERLLQARQRSPFQTLDQVRELLGAGVTLEPERIAVGSRHFEILGRLRLEDRVLEERSLVERRAGAGGAEVVVLRRERASLVTAQGLP